MLCNWNLSSAVFMHVLSVYRTCAVDLELFLNKLEDINYVYKPKLKFVMYGDSYLLR
jgi:hypothetical protein